MGDRKGLHTMMDVVRHSFLVQLVAEMFQMHCHRVCNQEEIGIRGDRRTGRDGEFGPNYGFAGRRPQNSGVPDDDSYSRKIREADKIEVPPFPDITQIAPWRTKLMNSVAVASGNPDYYRVTIWLSESWSGKNFEELANSGGALFVTLDLKLASAMTNMMHKGGERSKRFRDRVNLKMEEASKGGNIIKGRQIVWMLLDSFKTFDRSAVVYGFDHLSALRVNNNNLHEFVIQWNHVLSNMGDEHIQTSLLRDAFYRKIEKVNEVSYDLNIYERMGETDPNKTYEFLMRCVETAIRMEDKRRNMTEREMALKSNAQKPVVKPAAIVMEGTGARTSPLCGGKGKQASPAKELPKKEVVTRTELLAIPAVLFQEDSLMGDKREKVKVAEKTTRKVL